MGSKGLTGGCAALVLAAGRGRRFGSDKRVAVLPGGKRLLETTLARVMEAFDDVWVVLRPGDDPAALGVDPRVTVVRAERADDGMGVSLAAGIRVVAGTSDAVAVAVLLGDMPWIEVETLVKLKGLAGTERIVVPVFEGKRGHPVVFGKCFWGDLMDLEGDQGGKRVIDGNLQAYLPVAVKDHGVTKDMDSPGLAS